MTSVILAENSLASEVLTKVKLSTLKVFVRFWLILEVAIHPMLDHAPSFVQEKDLVSYGLFNER